MTDNRDAEINKFKCLLDNNYNDIWRPSEYRNILELIWIDNVI